MKILVTGASGYLGSAIVRRLLAAGHDVIGLVRDGSRITAGPRGMALVVGDLADEAGLRAAAARAEGVIHAASSAERAAELDRTAVSTLLEQLDGGGRPFIYTSGLWQHGQTGDLPVTEDAPLHPPAAVAWRNEVEAMVRDAASSVRAVIVRPSLMYGNGGGNIVRLLAPVDGVVRHFGDGSNRWPVSHVDDVAELYRLAVESASAGSVYLGVSGEHIRVRDAAAAVAAAAGARVEAWDPADARQTWGDYVEAFMMDQVASGARARQELGWRPRASGLVDELRSLVRRAA